MKGAALRARASKSMSSFYTQSPNTMLFSTLQSSLSLSVLRSQGLPCPSLFEVFFPFTRFFWTECE